MTLTELQTKRDDILKQIEVARVQFGERSVQFGDRREALAIVDAEIARLESTASYSFAAFQK